MGFRRKQIILRTLGGQYGDDGNWIDGETQELTIQASVQPISLDEYTQMFPNGSNTVNAVKIYTSTELYTDKEESSREMIREADMLIWNNRKWKIIACHAYQSGVINHYKAYAQEVAHGTGAKTDFS